MSKGAVDFLVLLQIMIPHVDIIEPSLLLSFSSNDEKLVLVESVTKEIPRHHLAAEALAAPLVLQHI